MMMRDTVEVAFMFPPSGDIYSFQHHLGVAYIQAFLAAHGVTSKQVTPTIGSTQQECADQIIATGAQIVGFTCYDDNYYLVRSLASLIKQGRPDTFIIAGGPSATYSDELILTHTPGIDVCVRFEGEEATFELFSGISDGTPLDCLDEIAGISFRDGGSIVRTPDRPLFLSNTGKGRGLDGLPSPYLEGILKGTEGAGVLSARGCTHHCTYCNFAAMSRYTIRYHSIDRIIAELRVIQAVMEANPPDSLRRRIVSIHDDTFTLNVRRAKEICRRIIDEDIRLQLSCLCRADNIDEELVKLLKQAGFAEIIFGVESATPRILRNVKKIRSTPPHQLGEDYAPEKRFLSQIKAIVPMVKRYHMRTLVSIILGLPGETLEEGYRTVEFVRDLNVDHYTQNFLSIFPGTELFDNCGDYGIEVRPSAFLLPYETKHTYPVLDIPFGANSSLHRYGRILTRTVMQAFAGGAAAWPAIGQGITIALVETGDCPDFITPFSWLSRSLALNGKVIVLGKEDTTRDVLDCMSRANAASGLPTRECYYLSGCAAEDAEVIYKSLFGDGRLWNFQFPLIRLSKRLAFAKNRGQTQTDNWSINCLSEESDVHVLAAMADIAARQVDGNKEGAGACFDGVFLDECRWSRDICPALELRRVVISQTGEIRPCLTGQPLGTLADGVHKLRERASAIYAKLREDRNCEECPAEPWCPKCLFPYPISPQEYCEIQRGYPDMAGIVIRAKLANTFLVEDYL